MINYTCVFLDSYSQFHWPEGFAGSYTTIGGLLFSILDQSLKSHNNTLKIKNNDYFSIIMIIMIVEHFDHYSSIINRHLSLQESMYIYIVCKSNNSLCKNKFSYMIKPCILTYIFFLFDQMMTQLSLPLLVVYRRWLARR